MTYNTRKRKSETCGCQKTTPSATKKTKTSKEEGSGDVQVVKKIFKTTSRTPLLKKDKQLDVRQIIPEKVKQGLNDPKVLDRLATIYKIKSPRPRTAPTKKSFK